MHRLDARSKIIMLLFYSVSLFFVDTWPGMAAFAAVLAVVLAASKLPVGRVLAVALPIYVIAAFTVAFNSFLIDGGGLRFVFDGFSRGCFFACRMLLLVWSSLIVCFSTTSTQLADAAAAFLRPLRRFGVPVDDISMVFSIALRFIPLTAQEYLQIRDAQWSRGASFSSGGAVCRIRAHALILVPMFVGLFRRADNLACAMDARCYGLPGVARTSLGMRSAPPSAIAWTVCAAAAFVVCALFL